jgi:hypothetical protein
VSRTNASTAPDTSIWPPCPAANNREQRFNGRFTYRPSERNTPSPACSATRANRPATSACSLAAMPNSNRNPAAIASDGDANTANIPSPPWSTTDPPLDSTASRRIASWVTTAASIDAGRSSHRRVEPSKSVNMNVTVPEGNSLTPAPLHRRAAVRK